MTVVQSTVITNAGITSALIAGDNGPSVQLMYYRIGSSLILPTSTMTDVTDFVYQGTSLLTYQVANANTVNFQVFLDDTIGDFDIGNIGLFSADGTMFCITTLNYVYLKEHTIDGIQIGNRKSFYISLTLSGLQTVTNFSMIQPSQNDLPTVTSDSTLPSANGAPFSTYLDQANSRYGRPAISSKYSGQWWTTLLSPNGYNPGQPVLPADITAGVVQGDVVAIDPGTQKLIKADGLDDSIGMVGVLGKYYNLIQVGMLDVTPVSVVFDSTYGTGGSCGLTIDDATGQVTAVTGLVGGSYTQPPSLTVVGGEGFGCTLLANMTGLVVTSVTILTPGSGYKTELGLTPGALYYADGGVNAGKLTTTPNNYYVGEALDANRLLVTANLPPWNILLGIIQTYVGHLVNDQVIIDVTAGDVTLVSSSNLTLDQANKGIVLVVGTPGVIRTIVVPNVEKTRLIYNNSDSNVIITSSAGTTLTLPPGGYSITYCDASGNIQEFKTKAVTHDTIASASTCDLSTLNSSYLSITGTTTITSFGTGKNLVKYLDIQGTFSINYNATTLKVTTASNISVVPGDKVFAFSDNSGNWTAIVFKGDGTPVAPTTTAVNQAALNNSTLIANTAYADAAVGVEKTRALAAELVLTNAVAAETSRATTAEGLLAPKASPALTGVPTAPTASGGTNTTQLATTQFVITEVGAETTRATIQENYVAGLVTAETNRATTAENLLAPKASPALTGVPTAPTASPGTNTTQLATCQFVQQNSAGSTTTAVNQPAGTNNTLIANTAYADAAVGVETGRAVTAEALLVTKASQVSGSGYQQTYGTGGNTIKMWGSVGIYMSTSFAVGSISFPISFPTACTSVVVSPDSNLTSIYATGNNITAVAFSPSVSSCGVRLDTEAGGSPGKTVTVYWEASGH